MGLIRDIEKLELATKIKAKKMLELCNQRGIRVIVLETLRTPEIQKAYFAQGRESLAKVNSLRGAAGLWTITESENKNKITWTLESNHIKGKALDVAPIKENGDPDWNAPFSTWEQIGLCGEEAGLIWGGRWKQRDLPHFEDVKQ